MKAYKKLVILASSLAVIGLTGCNSSVDTLTYHGHIFRASATPGEKPVPLNDSNGLLTYTAAYSFQWTESDIVHQDTKSAKIIAGVGSASIPFDASMSSKDVKFDPVSVIVTDSNGNNLGSAVETDHGQDDPSTAGTVLNVWGNFVLPAVVDAASGSSQDPNSGGTPTTNGAVSRVLNFFRRDKVATHAPETDSKAKLLRENGSSEDKRAGNANAAI